MAKKHYMALDDVQSLWREKLKPAIPSMFEKEVFEGYLNPADGKFYETRTPIVEEEEVTGYTYSVEITGKANAIYVELSTGRMYRWGGLDYSEVGMWYDLATPSVSGTGGTDGLMTAQDKEKLNGIQAGAQVNPGVMGASGSTHASGLVPDTPTTAGTTKFLREDGTWQEVKDVIEGYLNPADGKFYATRTAVEEGGEFVEWQYSDEIIGVTDKLYSEKDSGNVLYRFMMTGFSQVGIFYDYAQPYVDAQTPGRDGLMSAADKAKLDGIAAWALAQTKPSYGYDEIGYEVATAADNGNTAGIITIDGTKAVTVIALTGDVSSLDLASGKAPAAGHSAHVILAAAAARTVTIAHDATVRVCPGGEDVSLSIPAGGYVEVDFLNANSKIWVRGV